MDGSHSLTQVPLEHKFAYCNGDLRRGSEVCSCMDLICLFDKSASCLGTSERIARQCALSRTPIRAHLPQHQQSHSADSESVAFIHRIISPILLRKVRVASNNIVCCHEQRRVLPLAHGATIHVWVMTSIFVPFHDLQRESSEDLVVSFLVVIPRHWSSHRCQRELCVVSTKLSTSCYCHGMCF
jgi:hypothetical protein